MPRYTTDVDGHRFEIEIRKQGTEASIDGQDVAMDPVWLPDSRQRLHLLLDGRSYDLRIAEHDDELVVTYAGLRYPVRVVDKRIAELRRRAGVSDKPTGKTVVKSPMPGLVVKVLVDSGQTVRKGDRLMVIEAMKMENDIKASRAGTVASLSAAAGDVVASGQELLVIE